MFPLTGSESANVLGNSQALESARTGNTLALASSSHLFYKRRNEPEPPNHHVTSERHIGRRHVTMRDVARRANVSHMTISRVLRSPSMVSEATRLVVEEAIRDTGYVHNELASSLSSNRSRIVAAIIPSITHSSLEPTIETLMETLRGQGLHLLLGTSGGTDASEAVLVEAMLAQRPCALFLHNTRHTKAARASLVNAGVPVVESGDLVHRPIDMCISYSNREAARAMTMHLAAQGFRRIAIASVATGHNERSRQRMLGYRDGIHASGLSWDPACVIETDPGFKGGVAAAQKIMEAAEPCDALFCSTGILAFGALAEFRRQGWNVPQRVGLAGFDDNDLMASSSPPLTAVSIPRARIGLLAAQALLRRLAGEEASRTEDVGFEIQVRASTLRR
jgi:LacI family transcriptional regulator, gluconate utilization system Gnt-I transcriptional repressor